MAELDDGYPGQGGGIITSSENWELITPHDTNNLPKLYKAIGAGATGGVITMKGANGTSGAWYFNPGEIKPLRPAIVLATGTVATPIYGLL